MDICVIVPAAGVGSRFASGGPSEGPSKIEQLLAGRPVFLRALELFLRRPEVGRVVLPVHPEHLDAFRFRWGDQLDLLGVSVIGGGRRGRWETVQVALAEAHAACTHVAVHDAARPLATAALVDRVFAAAAAFDAVVPGQPLADTVKRVDPAPPAAGMPSAEADPFEDILGRGAPVAVSTQVVRGTVPRQDLVAVQTPQVFAADLLREGYARITDGRLDPTGLTDDASVIEAMGRPVHVVAGEPGNLKITRPDDLELAEALARMRDAAAAPQRAARRLFADEDD